MIKEYDIKVIKSKNSVEILRYEKPIAYGYKTQCKPPMRKRPDCAQSRNIKKINRKHSNIRALNEMKRMIENNFSTDTALFITLTFREHITDVAIANKEFKKFIQRLRYRFGEFRYVAVIDLMKNGRVHYHMVADTSDENIDSIWGKGQAKVKPVYDLGRLGGYLGKHLFKAEDERMWGKKAILHSTNLDKAEILRGEEAEKYLKSRRALLKHKVYESTYDSPYNGKVEYAKFKQKPVKKKALPKKKSVILPVAK